MMMKRVAAAGAAAVLALWVTEMSAKGRDAQADGSGRTAPQADHASGQHGDHAGDPHRDHGAPANKADDPRGGGRGSRLAVAVDGRRTPSRVPDEVAYRHFILSLATRDDAPAAARGRQRDRIRPVGLSAEDTASLQIALKTVSERLEAITAQRKALGANPDAAAIATLRQQQDDVINGARQRIQTFLSPQGLARFERHLRDNVKNKIVIYGDAP